MAEEAQKNVHTLIGKEVCPSHVFKVWEAISKFVMDQFCIGHGVRIPDLATLTYKIFTTDVSQRNVIVDKIPLILISENLTKKYALKSKRPAFNLDIPEANLNMSAVADTVGISRSAVETVINEVIHAFQRALVTDNYVEFHFPGIGRLIIQCREVHQSFGRNFLCKYGFGEEIITDKCCARYVDSY